VSDIDVDGDLRSITARGTDLIGDLSVSGSLGRLLLHDATGNISLGGAADGIGASIMLATVREARIDSTAPIKSMRIAQWLDDDGTDDQINAPSIGRLGVAGDFGADLNLVDTSAAMTLGRMKVIGRLYDADVNSAGNIGMVSLGAMDGAGLYAGFAGGTTGLPQEPGDFNTNASIRKVTIRSRDARGIRAAGDTTFRNSNIAAATLGRVALQGVVVDNAGGSFGIVADHINKYHRQTGTDSVRLRRLDTPGTADSEGDFLVRLV